MVTPGDVLGEDGIYGDNLVVGDGTTIEHDATVGNTMSPPRSPGHVFYDRLQSVLIEGGFDSFAEAT